MTDSLRLLQTSVVFDVLFWRRFGRLFHTGVTEELWSEDRRFWNFLIKRQQSSNTNWTMLSGSFDYVSLGFWHIDRFIRKFIVLISVSTIVHESLLVWYSIEKIPLDNVLFEIGWFPTDSLRIVYVTANGNLFKLTPKFPFGFYPYSIFLFPHIYQKSMNRLFSISCGKLRLFDLSSQLFICSFFLLTDFTLLPVPTLYD